MIPVDAITERELDKRFDMLSEKLKEALTTERNLTIVKQICDKNRIADEEKRLTVQQVVALVVLGVIHYYDAGAEINEALSLNNPQFSNSIADELNAKIFSPLKTDLENNYHPIIAATPKIIQDINAGQKIPPVPGATTPQKSAGTAVPQSQPAPKIISQIAAGGPVVGATPLATNQEKAAPPPIAPKPKLPEVGWSKFAPEESVVKLSQTVTPRGTPQIPPSPIPPPAPKPATTAPQMKSSIDEFERIAMQRGSPKPVGPAEPAPFILHEDAAFKPQQKTPDFRIQLPAEKFDAQKSAGQPTVKPAVLELRKAAPPPGAPKPGTISSPQVVHYTEYKPPMPEAPASAPSPAPKIPPLPQVQRRITEITSQGASPPVIPKPPVTSPLNIPPTPRPPASQPQNKVIYKDYSEPAQAPKAPPTIPPPPGPPPKR